MKKQKMLPYFIAGTAILPMVLVGWVAFENSAERNCWDQVKHTLLTPEGQVLEVGMIPGDGRLKKDSLDVELTLPERFPYMYIAQEPIVKVSDAYNALPYFCGTGGFCYDVQDNETVSYHLALDTDKEFLIICFRDQPAAYLVVSEEPDVSAQQVVQHFFEFIDSLSK